MVQSRYRGLRLLLAERCCEMQSARRAKSQHAGLARSEQVWLLRLGSLLCGVAAQRAAGKSSKPDLSSRVYSDRPSRVAEEQSSEVQRLLHVVQSCRPCAMCAATNRRPLPSRCYSGHRWRGKRTHSVEMPSKENRGVTRWEAMQRYENVGEIQARLQNGKVHKA